MKHKGPGIAPASLADRIEKLSMPEPMSGCWLWLAATTPDVGTNLQYGRLLVGSRKDKTRRLAMAHRVSYKIYRGTIPDGLCVCHRCDNSLCVNPDHLFVGSMSDNARDMHAKGRAMTRRGSKHKWAKINEKIAAQIKTRIAQGQHISEIAIALGIPEGPVEYIKYYKGWAHVAPEEVAA